MDVLLHEGLAQLGRVRFEKTSKGFRQQLVEIARTSLGDERARLRGQRRRQFSPDSVPLHAVKVPRPAAVAVRCKNDRARRTRFGAAQSGHASRGESR